MTQEEKRTDNPQSMNLNEKEATEIEKLRAEIVKLNRPFYRDIEKVLLILALLGSLAGNALQYQINIKESHRRDKEIALKETQFQQEIALKQKQWETERDHLKLQIEQLGGKVKDEENKRKEIQKWTTELESIRSAMDTFEKAIEAKENKLRDLRNSLTKTQNRKTTDQNEKKVKEREIADLKSQISILEESLGQDKVEQEKRNNRKVQLEGNIK